MKNNTEKLMNIKNEKVFLYLSKVVTQLNMTCNNIIKPEKFQRAVVMFSNRTEDFETIKAIIDWHVENEKRLYQEHMNRKKRYEQNRNNQRKRTI